MKTLKLFFIFASMLLASCSDDFVSGTYFASSNEYSLNFTSSSLQDIPANGGVITAKIDATSAVNWELQSLPSWLTTTTMRGTGSQDISFNVAENESFTSSRTQIFNVVTRNSDWSITIPITATQQKKTKTLSVSPSDNNSLTFDAKGGQLVLTVTSNLSWIAECSEDFVHLSQTSGNIETRIVLSIDSYEQIDVIANRTATIYFKDSNEREVLQVLTITQTPLQYSLETENINVDFDQNRNSKVFPLGRLTGGYSVSSEADWLVISKNKELGNVDVTLTVEANYNDDIRTAKAYVYLDGNNAIRYSFTVTQKGNQIEVSPNSYEFSANGGSVDINVSTTGNWTTSCDQDWVTTQENGHSCRIIAIENNSLDNRNAVIYFNRLNESGEIVGKTVSMYINQVGRFIKTETNSLQFGPETSTVTFKIDSDAPWTLTSQENWITLSATAGNGTSTVNVTVSDNQSQQKRVGTLHLLCYGQETEISVIQNTAFLNIGSSAIAFDSKGGTSTVSISSNVNWTVSSSESWLTISPESGNGDNSLVISSSENKTASERTAIVTVVSIAGTYKINVSQKAPSLQLSINSVSFDENGGTSQDIVVKTDYDYDVSSPQSWITIKQTGNTFTITTEANKVESRTGYVYVKLKGLSGTIQQIVVVNQKGDDTPYIDLGLPSGTKWCAYNKGAKNEEQPGNIYTGSEAQTFNIPTNEQATELIKKCKWTIEYENNTVKGYTAKGPNGNTIFFPNANVIIGNSNSVGMYIWVNGSYSTDGMVYMRYSSSYGAELDAVAHKDQSRFSIREVR